MTDETIVAIYDTPAHAKLAAADLRQAGVPDHAISIHVGTIDPDRAEAPPPREQGFWSRLFGGTPDHDTAVYERSVGDGSSVLSVKTPDAYVDRVMAIVESHAPVDIDERATRYAAGSDVEPTIREGMSEEGFLEGTRVVNRGDARIRRFVVQHPAD